MLNFGGIDTVSLSLKINMKFSPFVSSNISSELEFYSSKSSNKKHVLVTGGAGFLGSILVRKLLKEEYKVTVLDSLYFGEDSIRDLYGNSSFIFIKGNIENIGDLSKALQNVNYVIHLAGIVGDPACSVDPLFTIQTNFFATQAFIRMCKYYRIERFIFASTCSVYGIGKNILNEKSPTNPVSLYARSKLEAEKILLSEVDDSIDIVIMRMATLYGWSFRPRFDLVANLFAAQAALGEEIIVQGGSQRRPLLHLEDGAKALILALKASKEDVTGQIFNVGSSEENYTILEIAEIVKKFQPNVLLTVDQKTTDKRDYWVDFTKISKVLKFRTERSLSTSIEEIMKNVIEKKIDIRNPKYSNYKQFLSRHKKSVFIT